MFQESLKKWQASAEALMTITATIAPEQGKIGGVCGTWSTQDVIAHLCGWQREAYKRFEAKTPSPINYDIDDFNAKSVSALSLLNWRETLDTYRYTYEDLSQLAKALTPEDIQRDKAYEQWLKILAHENETHTEQIRDWLATQ